MQKKFPLQSQAGRVALLSGVLSKTVGVEEIQHAMLVDTGKRQYRKPVVVEDRDFDSVADAARWLLSQERFKRKTDPGVITKRFDAIRKSIVTKCNRDDTYGYYWA